MKTAEFSPNDEFFKSPAGAVKANTNTRYRLKFSRPQNPEDVYLCITKDSESEVRYCMSYVSCDDGVYTYETNVTVTSSGLYFYCFKIFTRSEEIRVGADENLNALCGRGQDWQLTVFDEAFPGAQWLKGGIIYQIMPDRFNIGKERKKNKK